MITLFYTYAWQRTLKQFGNASGAGSRETAICLRKPGLNPRMNLAFSGQYSCQSILAGRLAFYNNV